MTTRSVYNLDGAFALEKLSKTVRNPCNQMRAAQVRSTDS